MREVLISAGEASGDLHAAAFAAELTKLRPDLRLTGIGGSRMEAAGVEVFALHEAVMGFVEVVGHLPQHLRMLREVKRRLASGRVTLVVLVDYPGFNLRVARAAKDRSVPVLYYITPQVWAWGASRLPKIARVVTRAAVILPFEEQLLRGYGIDARFVGHPLLDRARGLPSKEEARRVLSLDSDREVLALFPGSRGPELERHSSAFAETARLLERSRPGLQVIVSAAEGVTPSAVPFRSVRDSSLTLLRAADAALCKSGTSTLEAAIAGCPLIVAYRSGALSYMVARRLVKIPHIGLVNVVAGREVAHEFVQDDMQPAAMAAALNELLTPGPVRDRMIADLTEVRERLGSPGAAERVARIASGLAA